MYIKTRILKHLPLAVNPRMARGVDINSPLIGLIIHGATHGSMQELYF